jgi:hypothetical protein
LDLRSVLIEIHPALRHAEIGHALIGGVALGAHGSGRGTVSVDFLADGLRAADVHRLMGDHGFACLHRSEHAANYASDSPERGRVDFLFARRAHGRAMLARASEHEVEGQRVRVVDASDLVGLEVQSSSNDPSRRHLDLGDIAWLLRNADVDLDRVREYFRLFDREKELEALLAEARDR